MNVNVLTPNIPTLRQGVVRYFANFFSLIDMSKRKSRVLLGIAKRDSNQQDRINRAENQVYPLIENGSGVMNVNFDDAGNCTAVMVLKSTTKPADPTKPEPPPYTIVANKDGICCSCKDFMYNGYLCKHTIAVLKAIQELLPAPVGAALAAEAARRKTRFSEPPRPQENTAEATPEPEDLPDPEDELVPSV